jgi:hypothetical protein
MRIDYELSLDIFRYPLRNCRMHQEKIADFYETGKPRFEWEKIRQSYIIARDPTLIQVCSSCPLNVAGEPEGCHSRLFDFDTLLPILQQLKPESLILSYDYRKAVLDKNAAIAWADELKELTLILNEHHWSAAAVQERALEPIMDTDMADQYQAIYPWDGSSDESWFAERDYILLGIAQDSVRYKDSRDDAPAFRFTRLWNDNGDIYGETGDAQVLQLASSPEGQPVFEDYPDGIEIKLVKLPVGKLFHDILTRLEAFLETAVKCRIGIEFKEL